MARAGASTQLTSGRSDVLCFLLSGSEASSRSHKTRRNRLRNDPIARTAAAVCLAYAFVADAKAAELIFADFFAYEPITHFDFGYRANPPVVEIAYLRSGVDDSFTDVTVTLDAPDFKIVGHSCPSILSRGRSCLIFFSFDPQGSRSAGSQHDRVFQAELEVTSNEDRTHLTITGHQNKHYCVEKGLPLGPRCTTPGQ